MAWNDGLLPEQERAAAHTGSHARLLAGPGTGKTLTLTRHACYLISEQNVSPDEILVITFTRAAARELRRRIDGELGTGNGPTVSTLHSFALRQLLRNTACIPNLPQPLRIADDWEERNIILEDLKQLLQLQRIAEAREYFIDLAADWQSLAADEVDWEERFPDPRFLGAWREHRQVYGYTVRSELVYQMKKALEQYDSFLLDGPIQHLLVDEYQDLNRCDLAIIHRLASRNIELFVAGDDDQSIYGFRKAHPEGIRRFPDHFPGSSNFPLELCKRCDREILQLGLFVAQLDPRRIEKKIRCEEGRRRGEVAVLRFRRQESEAADIARLCQHLILVHGLKPDDILILIRSDHNGVFSAPIRASLERMEIPVARVDAMKPLDTNSGRALVASMRIKANQRDSLAWRTLLQVWCQGVGSGAIGAVYEVARSRDETFAQVVLSSYSTPNILPHVHRTRIVNAVQGVLETVEALFPGNPEQQFSTSEAMMIEVVRAAQMLIPDENTRDCVVGELQRTTEASHAVSIRELVRATEVLSEDIEQEIEKDKVNILTMHKAKGLTAQAVIVVAAEDQYIPGRAEGEAVDDERRLLYVSLTRAQHHLFVTYCERRTGPQRHTGRNAGHTRRLLCRFLVDAPLTPVDGTSYIKDLVDH